MRKYKELASRMQALLRKREDDAIARRLDVQRRKSALATTAPVRAAEIEKNFGARAAQVFDQMYDRHQLGKAATYIRDKSLLNVSSRCTAPDIDDLERGHLSADEFNQHNRAFMACIRNASERLSNSIHHYEDANDYLKDVRQHLVGLRPYLCSQFAGAQCIPDAMWAEADQLLPAALIDDGRSALQQYRYWLDSGLAQLVATQEARVTAYNERLAAREAEEERAERINNFANVLQTFADTLQQENQQGYGGYGGGSDSSTSAPGMR